MNAHRLGLRLVAMSMLVLVALFGCRTFELAFSDDSLFTERSGDYRYVARSAERRVEGVSAR